MNCVPSALMFIPAQLSCSAFSLSFDLLVQKYKLTYLSPQLITFKTVISFNNNIIINTYLQKTHAIFWMAAIPLPSFHIRQLFNDLQANGCCWRLCFVLLLVSTADSSDVGWHCRIESRHEYVNVWEIQALHCISGISCNLNNVRLKLLDCRITGTYEGRSDWRLGIIA